MVLFKLFRFRKFFFLFYSLLSLLFGFVLSSFFYFSYRKYFSFFIFFPNRTYIFIVQNFPFLYKKIFFFRFFLGAHKADKIFVGIRQYSRILYDNDENNSRVAF